jgi:hypothetical protein
MQPMVFYTSLLAFITATLHLAISACWHVHHSRQQGPSNDPLSRFWPAAATDLRQGRAVTAGRPEVK